MVLRSVTRKYTSVVETGTQHVFRSHARMRCRTCTETWTCRAACGGEYTCTWYTLACTAGTWSGLQVALRLMFDLRGFLNHRPHLPAGAAGCRWSRSSDAARPTRQVFSDLWALDCETWVWEQLAGPGMASPAPHPPARSACGLTCYQDHLVLFGGKGHDGTTFLGDLWTFSLHAGSWCVPLIDDRVTNL